jgi:hypothetical protein
MMKKEFLFILGFAFLFSLMAVSAQSLVELCMEGLNSTYAEADYVPGHVLVGFLENVSEQRAEEILTSNNLSWDPNFTSSSEGFSYLLSVDNGTEFEWVCTLLANDLVKYAEVDTIVTNYTGVGNCAAEGGMCGGIAGFACCAGLRCELEGDYPDAAGTCVVSGTQICEDKCGDGTCDEFACQGEGCACVESAQNCPSDCGLISEEEVKGDGGWGAWKWVLGIFVLVALIIIGIKIAKWLFWAAVITAIIVVALYIFVF